MSDYQVIARKFRPQFFREVFGQDAIVTTLKNAIKSGRLAQAYLFCGSRGTGKTTLARLLAKALNCLQPGSDLEPCNQCACCREIASGSSLDVLEIDGASHRGIEDIRQINDNVGYATSGNYKIFIIDEVHMLTKEAFNALLKTLEEPPPKVKFFFATTEPHKLPATILSRCQRFNLSRIPHSQIIAKLQYISKELNITVDEEALHLLAQRAEGGLRDAESLFDQILAFTEGKITASSVAAILGLMPREIYFEIDRAGKEGQFAKAFEIAHQVFSEGKDITFFIEGLIDHLRQILLIKVAGPKSSLVTLSEQDKEKYVQAASLYSREQCLDLIEYLLNAQVQLRTTTFGKISLETILLHVMRSHFRLSIEHLVRKLSELEQRVQAKDESEQPAIHLDTSSAEKETPPPISPPQKLAPPITNAKPEETKKVSQVVPTPTPIPVSVPVSPPLSASVPPSQKQPLPSAVTQTTKAPSPSPELFNPFVSEDPTPSPADLGKSVKTEKKVAAPVPSPQAYILPPPPLSAGELKRPMHAYDTLMHFAAVELEGRLQKT